MVLRVHRARPCTAGTPWLRSLQSFGRTVSQASSPSSTYSRQRPGSPQFPTLPSPWFQKLSLLDAVGDEQVGILPLIQQKHGPQVAHPLVYEPGGGDQFQALHL